MPCRPPDQRSVRQPTRSGAGTSTAGVSLRTVLATADGEDSVHNVAITGLGIISSIGLNVDEHSRRLLNGELGIKVSKLKLAAGAPPALGAAVEGFRARDWIDEKLIAGTDGFARFALAAATQAINDAGIGQLDPLRTAIVHGTSMGGTRALLEAQHLLETSGPESVPAKTMIKIWPNMAAAQIAMKYD